MKIFIYLWALALFASRALAYDIPQDQSATQIFTAESAAWISSQIVGQILDQNSRPLAHASIVQLGILHPQVVETNSQGQFSMSLVDASHPLLVKKPGYRKVLIYPQTRQNLQIQVSEISVNSLYLTHQDLVDKTPQMQNAMQLLHDTELNAIVVDFKDDQGNVYHDLKASVDLLHSYGVYVIARITSFKDVVGVRTHPELALTDKTTGLPWHDKKGITYLDPYNPAAQNYLLSVAAEAAASGFDEVQFDYVRFPTDVNRKNVLWNTPDFDSQTRTAAIAGFLKQARDLLAAQGTFVAADVFGITAYDKNDSGIGQRVEDVTKFLDYVCPMVYPSGFAMNSGGVKGSPDDFPGQIVEDSVHRYRVRADDDSVVRPWLQAFRDYSYDHRVYGAAEISAQIDAAASAKADGFMLWNAASHYTTAGLKPKLPQVETALR